MLFVLAIGGPLCVLDWLTGGTYRRNKTSLHYHGLIDDNGIRLGQHGYSGKIPIAYSNNVSAVNNTNDEPFIN